MTATVETVVEPDLAAIMPAEKVLPVVARSVTQTEADTGELMYHQKNKINCVVFCINNDFCITNIPISFQHQQQHRLLNHS